MRNKHSFTSNLLQAKYLLQLGRGLQTTYLPIGVRYGCGSFSSGALSSRLEKIKPFNAEYSDQKSPLSDNPIPSPSVL